MSLARSHVLRFCSNFKDPGLRQYSSASFETAREEGERVFVALEPPAAEIRANGGMGVYYNENGGCFSAGDVTIEGGERRSILDVRKGDRLVLGADRVVTVRCVVASLVKDGAQKMCALEGGVVATPWHPVSSDDGGTWSFPSSIAEPVLTPAFKVVSLVLEEPEAWGFNLGPYVAVSLGHGLSAPNAAHDYLGTSRVLDDLARRDGWAEGLVVLKPNAFARDSSTGLINSLV